MRYIYERMCRLDLCTTDLDHSVRWLFVGCVSRPIFMQPPNNHLTATTKLNAQNSKWKLNWMFGFSCSNYGKIKTLKMLDSRWFTWIYSLDCFDQFLAKTRQPPSGQLCMESYITRHTFYKQTELVWHVQRNIQRNMPMTKRLLFVTKRNLIYLSVETPVQQWASVEASFIKFGMPGVLILNEVQFKVSKWNRYACLFIINAVVIAR